MSVSDATVLIAAPPETVWAFIGNPDNWPRYGPGLEKVIQTRGQAFEVGAIFEGHGHLLFAPFSFASEVVTADRPHVGAIRSTVATFKFTATGFYPETPYGTLATMRVEIEPGFGGLFAGIADAVGSLAYRTLLQSKMMQVADVIDGGSRGSLSKLQKKVLRQLQEGKSDREIADRLNLGPRVVSQHVETILHAFKVPVREALAQNSADDSGEVAEPGDL